MVKHILKIIWSQRKTNLWIFAELVVVVCAVWWMADRFYVDMRTYHSPMGYDISDTWRFQLDFFGPDAPGYVADEVKVSTNSEDLLKLQEQIARHPGVDNVCISLVSAPYSFGNSWTGIEPVDGDSAAYGHVFQCRYVSPEYFEVFRIKDIHGNAITPQLEGVHNPIIVSEDMALKFFRTPDVRGRKIKYPVGDSESMTVTAVSVPYRDNEYKRSEPFFYKVLSGPVLKEFFNNSSVKYAELCIRMKQRLSQEEMNGFLREMGDRLTVNNLHVYSANSISYYKESQQRKTVDEQNRKLSMMAFLLLNVFFGIIGTFWLRGQSRRSELGVRIALGASKHNVRNYMYTEGLLLLFLTVPLTLVFVFNMLYMDLVETYRLPYSTGRFFITYAGTYLLMAGIICIGIWFPVWKAERIVPSEALHYE